MRLLNVTAFFFAVASALLLYGLNYDTRRLEAEVQAKERIAERARNDIAVLKAERGHSGAPDRIDSWRGSWVLRRRGPTNSSDGREVSELNERQEGGNGR